MNYEEPFSPYTSERFGFHRFTSMAILWCQMGLRFGLPHMFPPKHSYSYSRKKRLSFFFCYKISIIIPESSRKRIKNSTDFFFFQTRLFYFFNCLFLFLYFPLEIFVFSSESVIIPFIFFFTSKNITFYGNNNTSLFTDAH